MKVMKQTAVEWFEKNISKYISYHYDKAYEEHDEVTKIFEQAKEMEKEQIMDAWIEGGEYGYLSQESDRVLAEQYYNETFNTK
jgi:hemoglobin-like flavoprotein